MSDITPDPAAAPAVDAPVVPDLPADAAVVPSDTFDRLPDEVDTAYVERLKKESINHRLKAKEYAEKFEPWKDALDGWEEDQAEAVRELLAAAKLGDTDAIAAILGLGGDAAETPAPAAPAGAGYLTATDLERILGEREQKAQVEAQVKAIEGEAKALGYEQGSNDYALLFKIAHEQTNGDLSAADAKVKEWKQSLYDQFVADKAKGATPPPASGGPASGERQITTFEEAKAAALARFGATPVTQG